MKFSAIPGLAILVLSAGTALAVPVEWTLQDFSFDDGGEAFGSFIYDADLDVFSDVNLTTTTGSVVTGSTYTFTGSIYASNSVIDTYASLAADLTGIASFYFELNAAMTNLGGVLTAETYDSILLGPGEWIEGICNDPICDEFSNTEPVRQLASIGLARIEGVPVAAVPLPAGLGLLFAGLGAFGLFNRRKPA